MRTFLLGISIAMCVTSNAQYDLAVSPLITAPTPGCQLTSSEIVTITIVNASALPYSGTFDVQYTLNAGAPVVESVTASMPASGTFIYSFSTNADLTNCQVHNFVFTVTEPTDVNSSNDSQTFAVESDCPPTVGTISGATSVCAGANSGSLTLTGFNGVVDHWEWSNDSVLWNSNVNNTSVENYSNIAAGTWYMVVVGSPYGYCANDTTTPVFMDVDQPSVGGMVTPDTIVCDNGNNGTLWLSGYTGTIIGWETSTNGGASWVSVINPTDNITFNNLLQNTMFRAIIQNGSCPPVPSAPATVTLVPGSDGGTVSGSDTACIGNNGASLTVSGYTGSIVEWISSSDGGATWSSTGNNAATQPYSNLNTTTVYAVIVQQSTCPADTSSVGIITVVSSALIDAGLDAIITEGDSIQLNGSGGVSYTWSPNTNISNLFIPNPFVSPTTTTTYTLTAVDPMGCTGIDDVTITVLANQGIIANMISPNGDGHNDEWYVQNIQNFPESEVTVFNQYGQVVFEAAPYNNDWKGTYNGDRLPDGTYFYLLIYGPDLEPVQGAITIMGND